MIMCIIGTFWRYQQPRGGPPIPIKARFWCALRAWRKSLGWVVPAAYFVCFPVVLEVCVSRKWARPKLQFGSAWLGTLFRVYGSPDRSIYFGLHARTPFDPTMDLFLPKTPICASCRG